MFYYKKIPCVLVAMYLFMIVLLSHVFAISRRHDVDNQKYIQLAHDYPSVGRFLNGLANASGVLISPQWVLTASHNLMFQTAPFEFEIGNGRYQIDWTKRYFAEIPDPCTADLTFDIALVHLDQPVTHLSPAQLYTEDNEVDMEIIIVGFGFQGDGLNGVPIKGLQDHKLAGKNSIDAVGNFDGRRVVIDASGKTLFYDFDNPNHVKEAKNWFRGSNKPLTLEAMMTSGDSGGGVFAETSDGRKLIGISSGVFPGNSAGPLHKYGIVGRIVRMSAFIDWIHTTITKFESGNEPLRGLVAHWNFDDLHEKFVHDISGVGHRGRIIHAVPTQGIMRGGIAFNMPSKKFRWPPTIGKSYVEVPNKTSALGGIVANDLKIEKDFTIAGWIYRVHQQSVKGLAPSNLETIVTKASLSNKRRDFLFAISENRFRFYGSGKSYVQSNTHNINYNSWQHIAASRTKGILRFYINGIVIGEAPFVEDISMSDQPLIIGNFPDTNFHFIGKMDDLRIYNRGLNQREIMQLADVKGLQANTTAPHYRNQN